MLEGSAALGLLPRLCVPLREQDLLLGYLMVIDAAGTVLDIESAADAPVRVEMAHRTALRAFAESSTVRAVVAGERATLLQLRPATAAELRAQAVRRGHVPCSTTSSPAPRRTAG